MSNKNFFVSLLVNAKCGGRPAAGTAQNLAQCDVLREQPGRRPARDCVKTQTSNGGRPSVRDGDWVALLLLISACYLYRTGALGPEAGEVSVGGVTGRDRQIRIFRCSKRNFRFTPLSKYSVERGALLM